MHIVYAMQEYPIDNTGCAGSGNYVRNIAKIMVEHGHTVEVVTEGKEDKIFERDGVTVHVLNIEKYFHDSGKSMTLCKKVIKNLFRSYKYNQEINLINQLYPIDIIQFGAMYNLAFFRKKTIPSIIRLSEYPVLWRRAGIDEHFSIEQALNERRLDEELQIYTYRKADKVIAPSFLLKTIVEKQTKYTVDVIESPIYIDRNAEYYQNLKIEPQISEKKYFLYFGGISARKEAHIIGEMIPRILESFPDFYFVIAGKCIPIPFDDKQRNLLQIIDEYETGIKKRCIYLGNIEDRTRLFSVVANSELCILPTRIDNLPNTVIEAMGLEKVVISTEHSSVEQLITDGVNGFLCKIDDGEDLYTKVEKAMSLSEEERQMIGKRAKQRLETMQPHIIYQKMISLYMEVSKRKG